MGIGSILVMIMFWGLVCLFDKFDDEVDFVFNTKFNIPYIIAGWFLIFLTLMFSNTDNTAEQVYILTMCVYMLFSGYTDLMIKRLYTIISLSAAVYGYISLAIINTDIYREMPMYIVMLAVTLAMLICTGFGTGDIYLMIVFSQYILYKSYKSGLSLNHMYAGICLLLIATYIVYSVIMLAIKSIKRNKKEKGKGEEVPVAPSVLLCFVFLSIAY